MADSPVRRSTRVRRPTLRTTAEEDGEEETRQRRSSRESRAEEDEDEAAENEAGEEDEDEELEEEEGDEEEEKEEIKEEEEEEEREEEGEEEDGEGQKRGGKEEKEPAQEEVPIDESLFRASKWASLKGMLLNRTLYLHSLSPLHIPPPLRQQQGRGTGPQAAANSVLTTQQLDIIGQELKSYLSIRLNDSLLIAPASEEGPSRRAEAIGADRLKFVQAGFLSLGEGEPLQRYLSAAGQTDDDDDGHERGERRLAWAIEIQIKAAPVFLPSGRMRDRSVELAHLVFLPSAKRNHYPLVLSKAPSVSALTSTSADDIDGATAAAASSLTARALIAHAFDYMTKRFDCRLTSGTALSSLRGPNMVRLAEAILSSTYAQIQRRRDDLDEEDRPSPPVELTFALPNQVLVDEVTNKRKRGPNPRLATLSLTVPWRICRQLLVQEEANGEAVTEHQRPLLPALARYVEEHTSISTDQLSLVRMSIAAVSIGSPLSGGGLTTIATAAGAGAGAGGITEAVATEMSSNTFSEPTRTTGSGAPSLGVRLKIAPLKLPDVASSFAADDDRPGVSIKDVDSWRIQDVLTELLDAAVRESW